MKWKEPAIAMLAFMELTRTVKHAITAVRLVVDQTEEIA